VKYHALMTRWNAPEVVEGFTRTPPNADLLAFARAVRSRAGTNAIAVDIGCGAGRNAIPLAQRTWRVVGLDMSATMLNAAAQWAADHTVAESVHLVQAPLVGCRFATGRAT
jgi:trans-aconitate methyltransferase